MKLFQLFESRELNSELLWFQRYISDNDLETELEIDNDKIVFRVGEKLIEWDVAEARRIRTEVMINANQSYWYARDVIKGRFELGEPAISKDAGYSYSYAKEVIKGQFKLGEPVLSKDANNSYYYAKYVIKRRFELGEPAISKDTLYSYWYAKEVIKGRFELGEPAIATDIELFKKYQEWLKLHS